MTAPKAEHRVEYRVAYSRVGWGRTKAKTFGNRAALDRFVEKLTANLDDREDLAPIDFLRLDRRPVAPWEIERTLVEGEARW